MTSDESIENNGDVTTTPAGASRADTSSGKRTPGLIRKKSLASLKDFGKKLIDHKAKLTRTQSQKCPEKPDVSGDKKSTEEETDEEDGLFPPTATLHVPGYDHKTKQFITHSPPADNGGGRKSSTPQMVRRRSSRDRMSLILDKAKVVTRQRSTPCLFKRDSNDKMKKIEMVIDEKIDETTASTNTEDNDVNKNTTTSTTSASKENDENSDGGLTFVAQRKALIAAKQEQFRQKGLRRVSDSTASLPCSSNNNNNNSNNVRHMAMSFDDGSAFVKVKNLANQTSDLSLANNNNLKNNNNNSLSQNINNNKKHYYENSRHYDSAYDNSRDCENERKYLLREFNAHNNNRASRSWTSGMESGYSSPVDNYHMEKELMSAKSWSESDEMSERKWMAIPSRDCTRDLCATVL